MPDPPRLNKDLLLDPERKLADDLSVPSPEAFVLPEKILQFGSGRFLRGFVNFFVEHANRQGVHDGRIVVVQTTGSGRSDAFAEQDGIFTLWERGLVDGEPTESFTLISSVSRALSASENWDEVLRVARSEELQCVVSNTTEVGIALDPDDTLTPGAPRSFPGKLTAFLFERGRHFGWAEDRGLVVLPCELLDRNGELLREIVLDLGKQWGLGGDFERWVVNHQVFCNTLVDRIVTSLDRRETLEAVSEQLGYVDHLMTIAEPYRLWAIEGSPDLRERLPFLRGDRGIVVSTDISSYRERKVRILNGAHTSFVALAYLVGCNTVLEAMQDPAMGQFIRRLILDEIVPTVPAEDAADFALEVLDRFANPFLEHLLINVTLQGTSKWRVRVVPTIKRYRHQSGLLPKRIMIGFAAHLLFVRGVRGPERFEVVDQHAARINEYWVRFDSSDDAQVAEMVRSIAADDVLWGEDLTALDGFVEEASRCLIDLLRQSPVTVLKNVMEIESW